ncbi:right-handed parallel beta-helix repeat-containing protein [Sphingomonas naasensis]|nr:right-handed parallel beta-helix repeat-containing protein [Sphingomonas naasensis]
MSAAALWASPAAAQATRTWVSGVGDDVNPCSRTAPCKTFAGAISKTAAGGEINCLDPGGFGTVTITKSMTIDCSGTFGSVLNSGGINGVVVNDSATATPGTIDVKLRGLSIDGAGTTPGLNGIRFVTGRSLIVEDVFIQNQKSGSGVSIQPTTNVEVYLTHVTVADGGTGVLVQPTGTGTALVTMRNVFAVNNSSNGVRVDSTGNTGTRNRITIYDSELSGNNTAGLNVNAFAGTAAAGVILSDSTVSGNGTGIIANGGFATVRVSDTTITGNTTGVSFANSSAIFSYGDNLLDANPDNVAPNNGAFTGAVIPKR